MASSTFSSTPAPARKNDWSAAQYLKFDKERTRAVDDLIARVPLPGGLFPAADAASGAAGRPLRIIDLGCGPGNSTAVLARRFPGARLSGLDSSPDMIARARATLPASVADFALGDLRTYDPAHEAADGVDLFFSNAALHWLRLPDRLATELRILGALRSGGVLAFQVPDSLVVPSHTTMHEVGRGEAPNVAPDAPWVPYLRDLSDRDPIETPEALYDALAPHCASVEIWHSFYYHIMPRGVDDIVEWVKGTGLQPFLHALPKDGPDAPAIRDGYVAAYRARLADFYKPRVDGSVLLRFPRLFVVAVKK